jgi:beta-glucosidase
MFEYHLEPFKKVIEHGVSAIMPYYGVPTGLVLDGQPVEEVGFGFNKQIIQGLLRDKLGYDGVVCTDWSLLTESRLHGRQLPARAWGTEHLSVEERVLKILDAGCDQFGGEECPEVVVDLVTAGLVSEERIDRSVRRLLAIKFQLGLFDDPYVDEDAAQSRTGRPEYVRAGERAQARSVTLLKNESSGNSALPLRPGLRVFSEQVDQAALVAAGLTAATDPDSADVALVRLDAPYDPRDTYMLESSFHAGSLDFDDTTIRAIRTLASHVPVILVVHLDRPAVLTPLEPHCAAIAAVYGASDTAVLQALTATVPPEGRLPFQLPRSFEAVVASRPDVPGDTGDALYASGFGLALWPNG